MPKIAIIPGSSRTGSINVKLAHAIARKLESMDAQATVVDLGAYDIPIYNGDFEEENGTPQGARDLAAVIAEHQGVVLVNPEYNASLSPLMKNTLDWLSRDVGHKVYQNRIFALAACSPGALGGIRALSHVRDVLVNVGAEMITPQLAVGPAGSAFGDEGDLTNERAQGILQNLCETLIERANRLA